MSDVRQCIEARRPLYPQREAVRLSHHELLDGLTVDDYAGNLLFTDYRGHDRRRLTGLAEVCLDALGDLGRPAIGAVVKVRPDNLSHKGVKTSVEPALLAGSMPADHFEVVERGMRFDVSFVDAGFATGLFLDMAEGRAAVRGVVGGLGGEAGADVLNLFSYTGPFSIAAAVGGAGRVIEVDTSGKWLGWSQTNQRLNGVSVVRQRREDAVKYLAKQADDSFDLIVCDPPSYANPKKGRRFTIEAGYQAMASHFTRVLRPGGRLLACCNHAGTSHRQFQSWLPDALKLERWIDPPPDFPGADYLKIALLRRV